MRAKRVKELRRLQRSTPPPGVMRLGWWWWIGHRRTDGRSGHAYTMPLLMTLAGLVRRARGGVDVGWWVSEKWFSFSTKDYSPAIVAELAPDGARFMAVRCSAPKWAMRAEMAFWRWRGRSRGGAA